MSDLEDLKRTFKLIGINFNEVAAEDSEGEEADTTDDAVYDTMIRIKNGFGCKGFWSDFYFLDGVCVGHGVWE